LPTNVDSEEVPLGGTDLGTRYIFTDDLRDKKTNPAVGQHSDTCVLVRTPDLWLCHAGWKLPKGDLVVGVLWTSPALKFTAAIFGGTKGYRRARGQIKGATQANTNPTVTDYKLEILTFP
jgi:hypothetical protein